ncbi:putative membrane protein [Candidatus Desulfosporosinus infrequens]|uniref:Putative membrane protein n=1 Tax=Candidatus Desulfosporosinus infrequens TaxID=2043169 RepID=A0A2U3JVR5_9FIRM|nr:putative membrane protein [Candidatus Desulfosporosinus infrequens]
MARSPIKHLIEKEGIAALFFLVFCTALALKFPAGVGTSNQAPSVSHAVAPWIFGPFQILLLYLPPWLGALVFPLLLIAGVAGLPWLVDLWGVKSGQRIFVVFFGLIMILLIWFMVKEFWWT